MCLGNGGWDVGGRGGWDDLASMWLYFCILLYYSARGLLCYKTSNAEKNGTMGAQATSLKEDINGMDVSWDHRACRTWLDSCRWQRIGRWWIGLSKHFSNRGQMFCSALVASHLSASHNTPNPMPFGVQQPFLVQCTSTVLSDELKCPFNGSPHPVQNVCWFFCYC